MDKINNLLQKINNPVVYETGGDNEFISANIYELTGYYSEEIILNRDLFPGLIHPEDYIETNFKIKNWHKDGEPGIVILNFRFNEANGQMIWIEDHLTNRNEMDKKYMQGLMINITDEKLEETQLLQEKITNKTNSEMIEKIESKLKSLYLKRQERIILVKDILDLMRQQKIKFSELNLDFLTEK